MSVLIHALDQPNIPPHKTSDRIRHEIAYFALTKGDAKVPVTLGESEYWIPLAEAREVYDNGVVRLVSPLDSGTTAEIELSEEQEAWLEWLLKHNVQHIRLG